MGKRSIGELPVFDVLVILVLGTVVGADIADPKIEHIPTFVAVIAIGLLHRFITFLKIKNRRIGHLLTFEPTVVIYKGEFLSGAMKKINYSIDNVLQMLREKDVFQLSDVELGIIEASGRLSVSLKPDNQPVTTGDLKIHTSESEYEIPLILDGQIELKALKSLNKSEDWLHNEITANQVKDPTTVFYASFNPINGKWHITKKHQEEKHPPPIFH